MKSKTNKLDALLRFTEDPEEVATMSREQVQAYLREEGIDLSPNRLVIHLALARQDSKRLDWLEQQKWFRQALDANTAWQVGDSCRRAMDDAMEGN